MAELGLVKHGESQVTPTGALYLEQMADTLHRVRKYKMKLIGGDTKELTHSQYEAITNTLVSLNGGSKFFKFNDGEIISSSQIVSIKPYEVIVDTRRDNL